MRTVLYSVAASLDGFIARPDGSYDWIPEDDDIDWDVFLGRFDAAVMGRKTYELVREQGEEGNPAAGMETHVFSRTLEPGKRDDGATVSPDPVPVVRALKDRPGKSIWLLGGGSLFRSLLDAGLVDRIEVAVVPVLLGDGIPLLPPGESEPRLSLAGSRSYGSGIVLLEYEVVSGGSPRSP